MNSRLVVGSWWLVVLALGLSTLSAAAQTPDRRLAKAVKANDATTVATLLRGKANPNVADVDGTTPLQWAVRNNNPGLVDRLLAAGADAKAQNRYGVTDGHHAISHHQNRAEKMEKNVRIQTFNVNQFKGFLDRLQQMPDGDGTLLDHTLLLYGSNMSNSNAHDHFPLPNLVVGGAAGRMKGGRHLKFADHTPMTNLLVTMLDKVGVKQESLGDSPGTLENL